MHRTTPQFWKRFYALPEAVQGLARKNYELLKADRHHPSLNFKKVGKKYWSIRVGLSHRALAIEDGSDFIWVWIGDHDEYDRLIR
ncbi:MULTISPECIES: hypothetical protein [unclassified Moorena]|uniref:ParE family toxin-like protein n=1 Tax=unclassified Moorena TaxID=2683338 RepID=UPI0013CBF796|nr:MULTISPECIES: hypothetical protein [unclassified Moorena]NEO23034.1 hypothetical protein [Moorena sp. SIO4A5]NEP23100.1 hypothetical protein [Moorena sp. SIO3I6]NEQ61045.1 hypothetical protein [Moorena sp. SIO4A1]